jgi:carbonic anhydrase
MRQISRSLAVVFALVTVSAAGQSPDELWKSLMEGNRAYVAGHITYDHLAEQRRRSVDHQNPPVTVLSCSDSRVPPELLFNRSVDQLFVIRVAGNVAGPFDLASIEYAVAQGYTKLIVVMGHEECGAVKAALDASDPPSPSLIALVQRIRESFTSLDTWSTDASNVRKAVEANARSSATYLLANSAIIRDAARSGKVSIAVAYYDLSTGQVERIR